MSGDERREVKIPERLPLNFEQSSRWKNFLRNPVAGLMFDVIGDLQRENRVGEVMIYGGTALALANGVASKEDWEFDTDLVGDVDVLVSGVSNLGVEVLADRLRDKFGEFGGRVVEVVVGSKEFMRVDIKVDGVVVGSVQDLDKSVEHVDEIRNKLGMEMAGDGARVIEAKFTSWPYVTVNGNEVMIIKDNQGVSMDINSETLSTFAVASVLAGLGEERLARMTLMEVGFWNGVVVTMEGGKPGSQHLSPRALEYVLQENRVLGHLDVGDDGFKTMATAMDRRIAKALVKGDWRGIGMIMVRGGMLGLISPILQSMYENENVDEKYLNMGRLLNGAFLNGRFGGDVGAFLALMGLGAGLEGDGWARVAEEIGQRWVGERKIEVSKIAGMGRLDRVSFRGLDSQIGINKKVSEVLDSVAEALDYNEA